MGQARTGLVMSLKYGAYAVGGPLELVLLNRLRLADGCLHGAANRRVSCLYRLPAVAPYAGYRESHLEVSPQHVAWRKCTPFRSLLLITKHRYLILKPFHHSARYSLSDMMLFLRILKLSLSASTPRLNTIRPSVRGHLVIAERGDNRLLPIPGMVWLMDIRAGDSLSRMLRLLKMIVW
ncbi:Uncharacterised protein [Klebsiella pneumoniae]|nr:Uncharacterised protein [Klebsiella pneumoniae]